MIGCIVKILPPVLNYFAVSWTFPICLKCEKNQLLQLLHFADLMSIRVVHWIVTVVVF